MPLNVLRNTGVTECSLDCDSLALSLNNETHLLNAENVTPNVGLPINEPETDQRYIGTNEVPGLLIGYRMLAS